MLINCTRCGTPYNIDESKIPPSGGKVTCRQCKHVNIVYPSSKKDISKHKITIERPATAFRTTGKHKSRELSSVKSVVKDKKKESSPALPVVVTDANKAPQATKPLPEDITQDLYKKEQDFTTPTESMDLDQREVSNVWKLRSESGLIYDFQSLHDLQKWARGRGNLKKMQISRDGNIWKAYEEYSQLIRLTASKEPPGGISLGKGVLGPLDQKPSLLTTIPGMSQQAKEPAVPPISKLTEESNVLMTARTGAVVEKRFTFDVISFLGGLIIGIVVMFALFYFKII